MHYTDVSMETQVTSAFRKLVPQLSVAFKKENSFALAEKMKADRHINAFEHDAIMSMGSSIGAARKLLEVIEARGYVGIQNLATAVKAIDMTYSVAVQDFLNILPGADIMDDAATATDSERQPQGIQRTDAPRQSAYAAQSASRQSTATGLQLTQGGGSSNAQPLYVAVLLRLSARGRYLEVHVLVDSDKQALRKWQQSVNKVLVDSYKQAQQKWQQSVSKESPDQQHMPEPELITIPDFSVSQPVAVALTSTTNSEATLYYHGCRKTSFSRQPHDNSTPPTHSYLVDLATEMSYATRQYTLHFHKTMPASSDITRAHEALGDAICKSLNINPEHLERCLINQLGFMEENLPLPLGTSGGQPFGRLAKPGEVAAVKTLVDVYKYYQRIAELAQSVGWIDGPAFSGTGFCVGNDKQKYFMTCRHVVANAPKYEGQMTDVPTDDFKIIFENLESGEKSLCRGYCVAEDKLLDYAILKIEDAERAPKPIPCYSTAVPELVCDQRYLTVIGFSGELVVDRAVELQTISRDQVQWVKDYVTASYLQIEPSISRLKLHSYVQEYDGIITDQPYSVFYNVAQHKQGSSGSPVLMFGRDGSVTLIALHRCGYPKFYYDLKVNSLAHQWIPIEYTIEAGTRLSVIYANLVNKNQQVADEVFDN